jgi:hypothetical protein
VRVEITLTGLEAAEYEATRDAFLESSAEESTEFSAEDSGRPTRTPGQRRADAFMGLVRTGMAHAQDGHAAGADRYQVHLVQLANTSMEHLDGTPVDAVTAERVNCDCSTVEHLVRADGEHLSVGRKTRVWSTAQRRAITVRDGGRCRFPGCQRQVVDIHHLQPWEHDGRTDLDNGMLCCPRHHTLLHDGFIATGDANHSITFARPDGTVIDATTPRRRPMWPS